MGKLFYIANCYYWDQTTDFAKCRNDVVRVAKDLYGDNSKEVEIVKMLLIKLEYMLHLNYHYNKI